MSVRPLAPFNIQELDSVDDALAMFTANIEDLMVMCNDQYLFDKKDHEMLDSNVSVIGDYCDKLETLIREEKTNG